MFRPVDRRGRLGVLGRHRRDASARLSPAAVRLVVRRRAASAGVGGNVTAHSTRSGFATQAAANGATERANMDHGRWRSLQVARTYTRRSSVFTDNPVGKLGL